MISKKSANPISENILRTVIRFLNFQASTAVLITRRRNKSTGFLAKETNFARTKILRLWLLPPQTPPRNK
jgi:hypothetical protein